jgi:hypothetical protein
MNGKVNCSVVFGMIQRALSTEKADIQLPDDNNIIDIVNDVLVSWTLDLFYNVNSFCGPKSSVLVVFYF